MAISKRIASAFNRGRGGAALNLVATQVAITLGSLATNILMARALGPDGRGDIAFLLQFSYVLGVAAALGRDRALPVASGRGSIGNSHFRATLAVFRGPFVLALLFATVGVVALSVMSMTVIAAVIGMVLLSVANVTTRALRAASIISGSARGILIATLVSQATMVLVGALLLNSDHSEPALWLGLYGISQLVPMAALFAIKVKGETFPSARELDVALEARTLGIRLLPFAFIELVTNRIDRLLLPVLAGYHSLGLYTVAATFAELITVPARQVSDSFMPRWSVRHAEGRLQQVRIMVVTASLILGIAIPFGFVVDFLMVPVFGEEYGPARRLVPMLTIAAGLSAMALVISNLALAMGRVKLVSVLNTCGLVVVVVVLLVLAPSWGALGAATAVAAGKCVVCAVGWLVLAFSSRRR